MDPVVEATCLCLAASLKALRGPTPHTHASAGAFTMLQVCVVDDRGSQGMMHMLATRYTLTLIAFPVGMMGVACR